MMATPAASLQVVVEHNARDSLALLKAVIGPSLRGRGIRRGMVYMACLGWKFMAIFRRDKAVALGLLLKYLPPDEIEQQIDEILTLLAVNADEMGDCRGPGYLPHEDRSGVINGRSVSRQQREILRLQAYKQCWPAQFHPTRLIPSGPYQGRPEVLHVLYYGGHDITPRVIRLIVDFVRERARPLFLDAVVTQPNRELCGQRFNGRRFTVRTALAEMTRALITEIERTHEQFGLYLPVTERTNKVDGHRYQHLRDGHEAFVKDDGTLVGERHIAYDNAVLYYDALRAAYEQFRDDPMLWGLAREAAALAAKVRRDTIKYFWVRDPSFGRREFPAMCLEWREDLGTWVAHGLSSNCADGLGLSFYDLVPGDDSLTPAKQRRMITAIIERMMGPEFMTDVGLRMRGLRFVRTPQGPRPKAPTLPYPDYQGENVSWPVISMLFVMGLRRHGFGELAHVLEQRVVTAFALSRGNPEYWFVDFAGRAFLSVMWKRGAAGHPRGPSRRAFDGEWHDGDVLQLYDATMMMQLWSIAAEICASLNLLLPVAPLRHDWQRRLTGRVLASLAPVASNGHMPVLYADRDGLLRAQSELDPAHQTTPAS